MGSNDSGWVSLAPVLLVLEEFHNGNTDVLSLAMAFIAGLLISMIINAVTGITLIRLNNRLSEKRWLYTIDYVLAWLFVVIITEPITNAIIRYYHKIPVLFNPFSLSSYPDPVTVFTVTLLYATYVVILTKETLG